MKTHIRKLKLATQSLQQLSTQQLKSVVGGRGTPGQTLPKSRNGGGVTSQTC